METLPPVPLTLEGSSVLHQMMRINWAHWRNMSAAQEKHVLDEAAEALLAIESDKQFPSAMYWLLGHKGDLMFVHFRKSFEDLAAVELKLSQLHLWQYLEPATSYLSVVELGLYESTSKVYGALAEKGITPYSAEWNAGVEETLSRQREAMKTRLFPEIPPQKYICFYPMDRRRGEIKNWYEVPMEERRAMMDLHGQIGRRYAADVKQIISGSIGFDDFEWGVDLFAEDPLVFKKLIYEMRFDEVSAKYALFSSFYVGVRRAPSDIYEILLADLKR
jgi:chlorite dismutase